MNWSIISVLATPRERADTFVYLQRKRYGRAPEQAALALWKGVCTEPLARRIVEDLQQVLQHEILPPRDRSYLTSMLNHFETLSSGQQVVALAPYLSS